MEALLVEDTWRYSREKDYFWDSLRILLWGILNYSFLYAEEAVGTHVRSSNWFIRGFRSETTVQHTGFWARDGLTKHKYSRAETKHGDREPFCQWGERLLSSSRWQRNWTSASKSNFCQQEISACKRAVEWDRKPRRNAQLMAFKSSELIPLCTQFLASSYCYVLRLL